MSSSHSSSNMGTEKVGKLLIGQAIPAAIGFLVMSIYTIVDTIFVGRYVGSLGIAAITVVMPVSFLISSIGMAIGIGGASIIARSLGSNDREKASLTFGNQTALTIVLSLLLVLIGFLLSEPIMRLFGAKGDIFPYALSYYQILLIGVPFLAWSMMSNNAIRAQGKPRIAMLTLVIPAVANMILDPIFIVWLDWGMEGASWATTISYVLSAGYTIWFLSGKKNEIPFHKENIKLSLPIVREIFSIGSISLVRQGSVSILTVVLNQVLFKYGGEMAISIYGIVNRMMMFALFPVIGIMQGFMPIAGFNYGAAKWERVRQSIRLSISWGSLISGLLLVLIVLFASTLVSIFTKEPELIEAAPMAMIIVFIAAPVFGLQLIGAAYYQAIGQAKPALWLTLARQGLFLIPLVLILPGIWGIDGVWYSFPISDVLSATVSFIMLRNGIRKLNLNEGPEADSIIE